MKSFCISFLVCFIIVLSGIGVCLNKNQVNTEYLRIHVRAQSNSIQDQEIKYKVKDQVVEYLTPHIASVKTKSQAKKMLKDNLLEIERVANAVLKDGGFTYTCKAKLVTEEFPTRVYDGFTLEQGIYDALILELGSAKGDNWWCVVYPPLCFTAEAEKSVVYKSKIMEIIENFRKDKSS